MFELKQKDPARPGPEQSPAHPNDAHQARAGGSAAQARPSGSGGLAVIGRSIQIVGDLRGDEDLRIEGDIEGNIHLPSHSLTIGTDGRVRADAYAKSVIVEGEVNGDIYASECVTIRAKSRVMGNILASRVSLEEGARFKGSIDMDAQSVKAAIEKVRVDQPAQAPAGKQNGSAGPGAAAAEPSTGKTQSAKPAKAESPA